MSLGLGGEKEFVQNFGRDVSCETSTWKTENDTVICTKDYLCHQ